MSAVELLCRAGMSLGDAYVEVARLSAGLGLRCTTAAAVAELCTLPLPTLEQATMADRRVARRLPALRSEALVAGLTDRRARMVAYEILEIVSRKKVQRFLRAAEKVAGWKRKGKRA